MLQPVDKFGQHLFDEPRSIRNKSAEAPESRAQLANHSIAFEFKQAREGKLHIDILLNRPGIIAASCEHQVTRIDPGRNLTQRAITIRRSYGEGISAVNVCSRRTNKRQIQHEQRATQW